MAEESELTELPAGIPVLEQVPVIVAVVDPFFEEVEQARILCEHAKVVAKAFIPLSILNKPASMTPEKYAIIQRHPVLGHRHLIKLRRLRCGDFGSPAKLGWDSAEALSRMASWNGHFDKAILSAFVKTLGIYLIGSLLKMESGRLGLVVRQSQNGLTKPMVKAFRYNSQGEIIDSEMIDLSDPNATDSIRQRGGEEWLKFNALDRARIQNAVSSRPQPTPKIPDA